MPRLQRAKTGRRQPYDHLGALWRPRLCSLPDQNYADKNENKPDNPKQR